MLYNANASNSTHGYIHQLIKDLDTLERLHKEAAIDTEEKRMGVEQELFLVDEHMRAAPIAPLLLKELNDPQITPELARFNLEINLPPRDLQGLSFSRLEEDLAARLKHIGRLAGRYNADWLLAGILPTLTLDDIRDEMISPVERYHRMMDKLKREKPDGMFTYHIQGEEELHFRHPSALLEACNTSFQIHYQVNPDQFAKAYNFAQLIAAPCLAVACNSPFLFGRKLWKETRLSLFHQALDTRPLIGPRRTPKPRVTFGNSWLQSNALSLFREEASHYSPLLTDVAGLEKELANIEEGGVPTLPTLQHFNGTVYRWNRPRYGVLNGKANLRIENRYLPAGPTLADQSANTALWLGLMAGRPGKYDDLTHRMYFSSALNNFKRAAQQGLATEFTWLDNMSVSPQTLILDELLPIAKTGLNSLGVDPIEIQHYLGIIEKRVATGQTGAEWGMRSLPKLLQDGNRAEAMLNLTGSMHEQQRLNHPVHCWSLAEPPTHLVRSSRETYVEQIMTADLYTVGENDPAVLPLNIMKWQNRRHIPVEDSQGTFRGMVTHACFDIDQTKLPDMTVADIMLRKLPSVHPQTHVSLAISIMIEREITAIPVLEGRQLVGMLTERDFIKISGGVEKQLVQTYMEKLGKDQENEAPMELPTGDMETPPARNIPAVPMGAGSPLLAAV